MNLSDIRVFVCVPGVGKTYLSKLDNRFVDLDSIKAMYKYGYNPNVSDKEFESYKGNRGEAARSNTTAYMKQQMLHYLNETDKILLFAPNPQMVEMIVESGTPYCLVYHSKDCVEEIRQRMINRGNQENFINSMLEPIDSFYEASVTDTRPAFKIELFKGDFLATKLLPIINKNKPHFFRELNALSIKDATIVTPNKTLLPTLLKEKLLEKVAHLKTIFTKTLREVYLNKKNKLKKALALPEHVVKTKLATRVAADILELLLDFSTFNNTQIDFNNIMAKDLTEQEIYLQFNTSLSDGINLSMLFSLLKSYLNVYNLSPTTILNEVTKIKEQEGSFLNGKLVVYY